MTITLRSVACCDVLGLKESFQITYFGYAFFKTCQYATTYEKIYKGLKYVSIKVALGDLQKCII
jgi:hypothetical protein